MALKERLLFYTGINNYVKMHMTDDEGEDAYQHQQVDELREVLTSILPVPDPSLGSD
jgi:hypothetical protein